MARITKARAWCNNEVAYLAWGMDGRIDGLLGFMIVRVQEKGDGTTEKRLLPAWVAFAGQSNPKWEAQDTSVWPIQKLSWRDLTLRRSRDSLAIRDSITCHYEIWPVGAAAAGRTSVAQWKQANPGVFSGADPAKMTGAAVPLFICGDMRETNTITATTDFGDFTAVFNNGILSTQNLRKQLGITGDKPPSAKKLRDQHTKVPDDAIRTYLAGDILPKLKEFAGSLQAGEKLYAALYELTDPELVAILKGLGKNLHLILSTAGGPSKSDPNWDGENHPAREALHATAGEMIDRLFNTTSRIGHNKFAVIVGADGKARAVLTGSTNWTDTGLCCQANNTLVSRSASLAGAYYDYWMRLKADTAAFPPQADTGAANNNVQQKPLRTADARPFVATGLGAETSEARLWCSPNTAATHNTHDSPPPADLTDVFALMRQARQAILFLTFMPSPEGRNSVIDMACELGKENPDLLVLGAISSPQAMPNFVAAPKSANPDAPKLPPPAIFSPEGVSRVLTVRAAAVSSHYGDMEPELLSAGFAIIHDKIVVIDPFSPDCAIITGSHNLGFKASYCNDDNLVIIRGNQGLAQAYAVHVLDVFEHYRFRAVLEQRERDAVLSGQAAPVSAQDGFLSTGDGWQDDHLVPDSDKDLRAFL